MSALQGGNLEEILARGVTCTPLAPESETSGLTCAVCLGLLTTPLMHPGCGNMFCSACVASLTSCPLCRGSLEGPAGFVQAPKLVQNKLSEMRVRCDMCQSEMPREDFLQRHRLLCSFPCPLGCGVHVTMPTLKEHCYNGGCSAFEVPCTAWEPPLGCTWRGPGGQMYAEHVASCPLAKLIPLVGWAKDTVARLEGNIAQLERTVAELEAQQLQHHHHKPRSASFEVGSAPVIPAGLSPSSASVEATHTQPFSVGGRGCPGACCPVCNRMSRDCPGGGRYKCCGLCKDCGPCTASGKQC